MTEPATESNIGYRILVNLPWNVKEEKEDETAFYEHQYIIKIEESDTDECTTQLQEERASASYPHRPDIEVKEVTDSTKIEKLPEEMEAMDKMEIITIHMSEGEERKSVDVDDQLEKQLKISKHNNDKESRTDDAVHPVHHHQPRIIQTPTPSSSRNVIPDPPKRGSIKCKICHRVYPSLSEYNAHIVSKEKVVTCKFCGMKYTGTERILLLHKHVKIRHVIYLHCKTCKELFLTRQQLEEHTAQCVNCRVMTPLSTIDKESKPDSNIKEITLKPVKTSSKCEVVNKAVTNTRKYNTRLHSKSKQESLLKNKTGSRDKTVLVETIPYKNVPTNSLLKKNIVKNKKKDQDQIKKVTEEDDKLPSSKLKVFPARCALCKDKYFDSINLLSVHLREFHTDLFLFKSGRSKNNSNLDDASKCEIKTDKQETITETLEHKTGIINDEGKEILEKQETKEVNINISEKDTPDGPPAKKPK